MELCYRDFKFKVEDCKIEPHEIFFASISGSHAYNTNRKDSDLDVRIVTRPDLKDLISLPIPNVNRSKEYRPAEGVDVTVINIWSYLNKLLGSANGNFLENLFQEKIFPTPGTVWDKHALKWRGDFLTGLIQLVKMHSQTGKLAEHYKGFSDGQLVDYEKRGNDKCIIYAYRVLLTGYEYLRDGNMEMNMLHLANKATGQYLPGGGFGFETEMLWKYFRKYRKGEAFNLKADQTQGDFRDICKELEMIKSGVDAVSRLYRYEIEDDDWKPFNEWLHRLYNIDPPWWK